MDGWCMQTNLQGCCALCWFWTRSFLTSDCQISVIMMHWDESELCFYTCSSLEVKSSHSNVLGEDDCLLVSAKLCLWGVICSLMMELRCRMQVCLRSFSTCRLCDTVTVPIPPYLSSLSSPLPTHTSTHPHTHTTLCLSTHTFPFHHLCLFQFQKPCCDKHDKLKMISF